MDIEVLEHRNNNPENPDEGPDSNNESGKNGGKGGSQNEKDLNRLVATGGNEIAESHGQREALNEAVSNLEKQAPDFRDARKTARKVLSGENPDEIIDALVFRRDGNVHGKEPTVDEIKRYEQTLEGFSNKFKAELPEGKSFDSGTVFLAAYTEVLGGRLDERNAEVGGIGEKNKKEGAAMVAKAMDALVEYAESHKIGHGGKNPEDEPAVAGATAKEVIGQIEGGAAAPKTDPNAQAKLAALSAEEKAGAKINLAKSHGGPTETAETPRTVA